MQSDMKDFNRFDDESFVVSNRFVTLTISGLAGWRHKTTQEVVFDPKTDSATRYANACDALVLSERI